ncbi:hypothetical protein CAPTEDRAFT_201931 [Capitella teleta]|uniref:G-protein coupled receptors family 1 profile domain-containing protein n=1 Tax=Capitella teleta TaxID=283909 RepID=R7TCZ9_CAPTE|nr:hypothetical protein CAPTEDRAFT_201931 [Capitella teleta]|eukprot:ELT91352.1 hypothetical protein CAPTEDRAFT_201931 [Capitella teleta]
MTDIAWTEATTHLFAGNETDFNTTDTPHQWYDVILDITHSKFRELTEWYAIPGTAVLGIIGNVASAFILHKQCSMRRNTARLHGILLGVDSVYLALVLAFTQLRHHGIPGQRHHIEAMQYFTMFLNLFQYLGFWLLYVAATDAYRHFNSFRKATSLPKLRHTPRNLVLVIVSALLLHIPFVPNLRMVIWRFDLEPHDPCTIPIENHWNYVVDDVQRSDLFYILYFMLAVYLFSYLLPFFFLGCRDKDILDLVQTMQERQNLPLVGLQAGHSAFLVAALCNITLFCYVPKFSLMTFKLFEFAIHYMHWSLDRFLFINEIANLLLVVRAAVYFPVTLKYSPYSRRILWQVICRRCPLTYDLKTIPIIHVEEV